MLITSNFSFSHNVFYSYISLVRQNAVLCGNGLRNSERKDFENNEGKGRNCWQPSYFPFPAMVSTPLEAGFIM